MTQELRRKQVKGIISKLYFLAHEEGDRDIDYLLSLLSDAECKGAWAVVMGVEKVKKEMLRARSHFLFPADMGTTMRLAAEEDIYDKNISAARQVASSFGPDPEGEGK